jgi:hypothetical protein
MSHGTEPHGPPIAARGRMTYSRKHSASEWQPRPRVLRERYLAPLL